MADRFPSLEDFDEGQTEIRAPTAGSTDAASFLERERAALGEDADLFTSANDNLATVEDAGEDDLLGGGGNNNFLSNGNDDDLSGFESSFPAIDTTNDVGAAQFIRYFSTQRNRVTIVDLKPSARVNTRHMGPGGTVTGSSYLPGAPQPSYSATPYQQEEEPEVIKAWREKRAAEIAKRDEISTAKKQSTTQEAQQALDDFYDNYNDKKEKNIAQTRREAEEFLNSRDDTTAGGTSWERIGKLVDLSGKGPRGGAGGSGKERFRELLVSLRKDEKAPGATGY
ncbi:hypothetical protein BLS_008395 [Venturia inaequalis]|uniref:Clathrin light chain n=1 Tax=Venturia inaequalis TaxID=5025 RepID=A0A8H3U7N8_VENIN|nr:hypothetical protein BLS_008395 [Venturia inaequalis]